MSDPTIKELLLTMSLDEIKKLLRIIESRQDVFDLVLVTTKEQEEMQSHYLEFFERVKNEPA